MNNCFTRFPKQMSITTSSLLILLIVCATVPAQQPPNKNQRQGSVSEEQPDTIRWQYLLDGLATDARSLLPEKERPYALAAVADAYWNLDKDTARKLFMAALDSASSLKAGEKPDTSAINHVLAVATKRDVALTKTLLATIAEKQKQNDLEDTPLSVALDLLERDPGRATKLAESFVPSGLSSGTAISFIFRLAKQDIELANQIYRAYLNRFATDPRLPLNQLISFGGYAFGYSEFYGLTDNMPAELYGVSSRRITNLSLNPALARTFLDLALRRTHETVERAAQMAGAERDYLSTVSLFAIAYLLPEVVKYSPATVPAWEQVQQRATIGTTSIQNEQVGRHIHSINERRARIRGFDDAPQLSAEQAAETMLERAEKQPKSCQRDRDFSKAAFGISSTKDFKRALAIADRISDLKQRDDVKQFIFFDMALAAGGAGEWTEMRERAKSISIPEQVAFLYIKAAERAVHRKDEITALELLREAVKTAEKISGAEIRAGILLGAAAVQIKIDALGGSEVLKTAIKAVNQRTGKNQSGFSILMKVPLGCQGEDEWHGTRISLANATLEEVLPLFSAHDAEEALLIGREVEDPPTKVRALAAVVKYITDEKTFKPKPKVTVQQLW